MCRLVEDQLKVVEFMGVDATDGRVPRVRAHLVIDLLHGVKQRSEQDSVHIQLRQLQILAML